MAEQKKTNRPVHTARRQAREEVFELLYETEYHDGEAPEDILLRATEDRELKGDPAYVRTTYLGVMTRLPEVDALIGNYAKGWSTGRLSRVSRAVLRLGAYEIAFSSEVPAPVAINEAVELAKKYDDPKARAFVNGVLNAIKDASGAPTEPTEPAPDADEDPSHE